MGGATKNLLWNCWRKDQGVKELQQRVFASVCKRSIACVVSADFFVFVELNHFLSNVGMILFIFDFDINPCE